MLFADRNFNSIGIVSGRLHSPYNVTIQIQYFFTNTDTHTYVVTAIL